MIDLDDLVAPAPRPQFREDVFREAESRSRRSARRRRLVLLALAVLGLVSTSTTAGVMALEAESFPKLIDRTISCPVPIQGGVPVFHVTAGARGVDRSRATGKLVDVAASLSVYFMNSQTDWTYVQGVTSARKGFFPGVQPPCRAEKTPVALGPSGLPQEGVYLYNEPRLDDRCLSGSRITIRLRANLKKGAPYTAKLAVRTGKKLRPMVFVDWTPNKVTTYLSPDCAPSR
jgi:hypothetical protein